MKQTIRALALSCLGLFLASCQSESSTVAPEIAPRVVSWDKTPPTITRRTGTATKTVGAGIGSATIGWNVRDRISGVAKVTINGVLVAKQRDSVYSKVVALAVGANRFILVAEDSSKNVIADTVTITRQADATSPVIVLKSPGRDTTVSGGTTSFSILVGVTDDVGVRSVTIGGAAATASGSTYSRTVSLAYGANTFAVVAEDVSGNRSTRTVVVTRADATSPVIVLKTPSKDTTVSGSTTSLSISASVTDNLGVRSVTIGGVAATASGSSYSRTVSLAYGANTFAVVAEDISGNRSTRTVVVTRADATSPVIVLKSPGRDTTVSGGTSSISVAFTATDDVGVASVTINGESVVGSGSNYSKAVPLSYGLNTLTIVARDAAGNAVTRVLNITRAVTTASVDGAGAWLVPYPNGRAG